MADRKPQSVDRNSETGASDSSEGDKLLKRMLKMPPKPHGSEKGDQKPDKRRKVERRVKDASDKE